MCFFGIVVVFAFAGTLASPGSANDAMNRTTTAYSAAAIAPDTQAGTWMTAWVNNAIYREEVGLMPTTRVSTCWTAKFSAMPTSLISDGRAPVWSVNLTSYRVPMLN